MANFGSILAGALTGGAEAAQGIARGHIEDERRLSVAEQLSQIEEARQQRIAEAAERRAIAGEGRREAGRREGKAYDFEQDLKNEPRATESAVARANAIAAAATDSAHQAILAGNDPDILAARKAQANAGRPDPQYSPTERANAEIAQLTLTDEKDRRALLDRKEEIESGSLRGDQRARALAKIDRDLAALERNRGGKKPDETDTVKKYDVDYKINPLTNEKYGETRTETIEKRRAQPAQGKPTAEVKRTPAPQDPAQREIGKMYDTPRGPLKWQGNGWLKP